jgi:lysophospholipase L1-like esterase
MQITKEKTAKLSGRNSSILFPSLAVILFSFLFFAFSNMEPTGISNPDGEWVGTWVTAPQLVEPRNMPPESGLSHNTLRQVVQVSLGGDNLRVRFSNEFSTSPVIMNAVQIAVSKGDSIIVPGTEEALKFDGETKVTIEPGTAIISDPFKFALEPLSSVAITIHFNNTSPDITGHPGSRTTSYLLPGNEVSKVNFANSFKTDHWYIINGIDVLAEESAAAVVVLGNSISDGRGSGTNKQNRWPDELARRLQEDPETRKVAVLNQGIGGNCVLRDCLGPAALNRFERDVIGATGVRWLIILEGINDIGQIPDAESAPEVADDLIAAYVQMIDSAHSKNIRVYGATLLPFGDSFYDTEYREAARNTINNWIRNGSRFDAVIDLDKALGDPENPLKLLPAADTGDHLHPNEAGHRMIAEAIDLSLFK